MPPTLSFNRMPRIIESLPQGEIELPPPPNLSPMPQVNKWMLAMPIIFALLALSIRFLPNLFTSSAGSQNMTAMIIMSLSFGLMSVGSGVMAWINTSMQRKSRQQENEEKEYQYAQVLEQKRGELTRQQIEQQRILAFTDPDLNILVGWPVSRDPHLWQRRPQDPDFLCVRVGHGPMPSFVKIKVSRPPMPDPRFEPVYALAQEFENLPDVPRTVNLRVGSLGIAGDLVRRTQIARAVLCNLVTHHSPDELHLLAIFGAPRESEWAWLKWLPHTHALDADPRPRYLANDPISTQNMLDDLLEELHRRESQAARPELGQTAPAWPWLVLLVDDYRLVQNTPAINLLLTRGAQLGATAIFLVDQDYQVPMGCSTIARLTGAGQLNCASAGVGGISFDCWPDQADTATSERLARGLAPLRVQSLQSDQDMPSQVRLLDMLGLASIDDYDANRWWNNQSDGEYLQVKIGEKRGRQPLILDLNHTGHGPHGLVAGTTGSGKSELLQTLILSLAMTHHPYQVGFVLVDFKGGGTFDPFKNLPHTLGLVTDLDGQLTTRAQVALEGEMERRKRLFQQAGVNDIRVYQKKFVNKQVTEPLPRLIVIIDEFAELVTNYPDFIEALIRIARVGRSLGVHLILATQSPSGVVKPQIWANARFRICLRVENRGESQDMLHRGDAANLPRTPGRGYLQVGENDVFELFQSAFVGARYRDQHKQQAALQAEQRIVIKTVSTLGQRQVLYDSRQARPQPADDNAPRDIQVMVEALEKAARRMNLRRLDSPWPAPLPKTLPLDDMLRRAGWGGWNGQDDWLFGAAAQERRCEQCNAIMRPTARFCPQCRAAAPIPTAAPAHRVASLPDRPWMCAMLGLADDPARQQQGPLTLPLAEQDGHLVVVGVPGSGKEMLLRTLVISLARTHTPDELHIYAVELGGQALQALAVLPHMGGIFGPSDNQKIQRLLGYLSDQIDQRQALCRQAQVDSLARLRDVKPAEAPAAILLVITGFKTFRESFQDEKATYTRLLRDGGAMGIHAVLVGDQNGDLPPEVLNIVSRRMALQLADVRDYRDLLGGRVQIDPDAKIPSGRGWYNAQQPPLEFQAAMPTAADKEIDQIPELNKLAQAMRQAWSGSTPPPIRLLPDRVSWREVLDDTPPVGDPTILTVPLGLDSLRLQPVSVEMARHGPYFLIAAPPQGGKTNMLLGWAMSLAERYGPQQVQLVSISTRRNSLGPLSRLPHTRAHCPNLQAFKDQVLPWLAAELTERVKAASSLNVGTMGLSAPAALPGSFPAIVWLIDDYNDFIDAVNNDRDRDKDCKAVWENLVRSGRDVNIYIIAATPLNWSAGSDALIRQIQGIRSGVLIQAQDSGPLGTGIRLPSRAELPPGRGYVVRSGNIELGQTPYLGDASMVLSWVKQIAAVWPAPPEAEPETTENAADPIAAAQEQDTV